MIWQLDRVEVKANGLAPDFEEKMKKMWYEDFFWRRRKNDWENFNAVPFFLFMLKRFAVKNPDSNEVLSIDQIELPGIVQKLLFWPWLLVVDNYIDRNWCIWLGLQL